MIPTSSSMQRFSLMAPQQPRKPSTMMITPMAIIRSMPGRDSSVIYRQEEVGDGQSEFTQMKTQTCAKRTSGLWKVQTVGLLTLMLKLIFRKSSG